MDSGQTRLALFSSTTTSRGLRARMTFASAPSLRILRVYNDYDFGEGTTPTVTYTDLPQFIYGVASSATTTFPVAYSQPFNFLNVDLYAQDTWKLTGKLTWTFGVRATHNSNPLNPHMALAQLPGAFDSFSHNPDQPLDTLIQTHSGNLFNATPEALWQPRTAIAWEVRRGTVVRSGFGLFSDLLPGSVADLIAVNPPYVNTFRGGLLGGLLGKPGGIGIAPGVAGSAVDATVAANQNFLERIRWHGELYPGGQRLCLRWPLPMQTSRLPAGRLFRSPQYRAGNSVRRTLCSGVWRSNISLAPAPILRRSMQGRAPWISPSHYMTQVNGYQTVCSGCFAPFGSWLAARSLRFGAVTQPQHGSQQQLHNGLQLTVEKRLSHRSKQFQVNCLYVEPGYGYGFERE